MLFCACAAYSGTYLYLHFSLERRCIETSTLQNLQDTAIATEKKTGAIWTDSDYLNSIIFHLYNLAIDHDESEDQNHSTPCFFPDLTIGINEFLCAAKVRWPWRGGFDDFKLVSHTTWLILAYQVHRHFPSLSNMLTKHHAAWSWSKSMSSKCNPLTNLIQTWCQN